jgi:hypothetical protein
MRLFNRGHPHVHPPGYRSGMSIDREDCDERQTRLDWMIDEFRKAQARRLTKANDQAVKSQEESDRKPAVTGAAPSQ